MMEFCTAHPFVSLFALYMVLAFSIEALRMITGKATKR